LFRDYTSYPCQALDPADVDGHSCLPVYLPDFGGKYLLLYLDAESKLPYLVQSPGRAPMTGAPVTQKVILADYQLRDGLQVATSYTIKHDEELFATGSLNVFEFNPRADDSLYQK